MKWFNVLTLLAMILLILASCDKQFNEIDYVEITVLIDNNPDGMLNAPWGLSMLIETNNLTILFDS